MKINKPIGIHTSFFRKSHLFCVTALVFSTAAFSQLTLDQAINLQRCLNVDTKKSCHAIGEGSRCITHKFAKRNVVINALSGTAARPRGMSVNVEQIKCTFNGPVILKTQGLEFTTAMAKTVNLRAPLADDPRILAYKIQVFGVSKSPRTVGFTVTPDK